MCTREQTDIKKAIWVAGIIAGLMVLVTLVNGCEDPPVKPLKRLCETACSVGHAACLDSTERVEHHLAQRVAAIGCDAGELLCYVGCAAIETGEASKDPFTPCHSFYRSCFADCANAESPIYAAIDACVEKVKENVEE